MTTAPADAQSVSFDSVRAEIEAAPPPERARLVDALWNDLEHTPLLENDTTVVFLHRAEAAFVGLLGDMSFWTEALPLSRVADTDLWYRRATFEADARLEYLFLVDEEAGGFGTELLGSPDPRNPHRVLSGFGPASELSMPRYRYPAVFEPVRDGTPGSAEGLDLHVLPPGVLPYEHEVLIYTPPGDSADEAHYPAVYFVDGRDYVEFAHVPAVLDALIGAGEIEPLVAVFVDPPNRHRPASPSRMTEYGMNDEFVAFLTDELVPFVDRHYDTRSAPEARLIVGDSYGGLIATYAAFRRSDVFGLAYSQSGYHSFRDDRMIRLLRDAAPPSIRLYADVGTYERRVGSGLLPDAETDFLAANRRLRDVLAARGYDFVYAEYPQGHTWGNWRAHLIESLRHFFPAGNR